MLEQQTRTNPYIPERAAQRIFNNHFLPLNGKDSGYVLQNNNHIKDYGEIKNTTEIRPGVYGYYLDEE